MDEVKEINHLRGHTAGSQTTGIGAHLLLTFEQKILW